MKLPDIVTGLVAGLFTAGVVITEAQLYLVYRSDSSYWMNINYVFGVLLAVGAAACIIGLSIDHPVGGGTTALILGSVQVLIFLRSQDPAYCAPPLLEAAAGIIAIVAYGSGPGEASPGRGNPIRPP